MKQVFMAAALGLISVNTLTYAEDPPGLVRDEEAPPARDGSARGGSRGQWNAPKFTEDIPTIVAAVDPELHPLRQEAEQVLKRGKPTRILITYLDVAVDAAKSPPQAKADVVVRVAGNTIEAGVPGDILADFRVLLFKKDGTWLIKDVEADRARLGQSR